VAEILACIRALRSRSAKAVDGLDTQHLDEHSHQSVVNLPFATLRQGLWRLLLECVFEEDGIAKRISPGILLKMSDFAFVAKLR
jgi:hypothetical protein